MEKSVSYKISYVTFISNIMILLQHSGLTGYFSPEKQDISIYIMDFFYNIAISVMGLFFFITAYLFFRKVETVKGVLEKCRSRIYTLVIPYMIWNTVGGFFHFLGGDYDKYTIGQIFRYTYLFYNGEGCGDLPLWYIFRILSFMIFSPVIFKILYKMRKELFILIELLLIALNIIFEAGYYSFSFFLPIYLMGSYVGLNYVAVFEKFLSGTEADKNRNYKAGGLIVLLIGLTYATKQITFRGSGMLFRIVFLIIILFILHYVTCKMKPSVFVASAGMYLYCAHDLIYRIIRNLVIFKIGSSMYASWLILIVVSSVMMIGSWFFLYRMAPKFLSVLSGGRSGKNRR